MATAANMTNDNGCSICWNDLKDPTALPCLHTFCFLCLRDCYGNNDFIRCPLCRETFDVALNELQPYCQKGKRKSFIQCDVCDAVAESYCTGCPKLYCHKHLTEHDNLLHLISHQRVSVEEYEKGISHSIRLCTTHLNQPYSTGCRRCLSVMCEKCISSGQKCIDGSRHHHLVDPTELVRYLMSDLQELQTRESDLNSTIKKLTGVTADFASETEDLLATLRNQRAEQLNSLNHQYDMIEEELIAKRNQTQATMTTFTEEVMGVKLSDVVVLKTKIETKLKKKRQIDIALSYARLKEEIRRNLSEGIPRPNPIDKLSLRVKEERREIELELITAKNDAFVVDIPVRPEETPDIPRSMALVTSTHIPEWCRAVHNKAGTTYVGLRKKKGIETIDQATGVCKPFIALTGDVDDIIIYHNKFYLLVCNNGSYSVCVYDLAGKLLKNWSHANYDTPMINKFAIVDDHILIPHRTNKSLILYSQAGVVMKKVPCYLLKENVTSICVTDAKSVIISDSGKSQIFKIDLSYGQIIWNVKHSFGKYLSITRYNRQMILAAGSGKKVTVWCLDARTGETLSKMEDPTSRPADDVLDLHISDSLLVVPRCGERNVLFYHIY